MSYIILFIIIIIITTIIIIIHTHTHWNRYCIGLFGLCGSVASSRSFSLIFSRRSRHTSSSSSAAAPSGHNIYDISRLRADIVTHNGPNYSIIYGQRGPRPPATHDVSGPILAVSLAHVFCLPAGAVHVAAAAPDKPSTDRRTRAYPMCPSRPAPPPRSSYRRRGTTPRAFLEDFILLLLFYCVCRLCVYTSRQRRRSNFYTMRSCKSE